MPVTPLLPDELYNRCDPTQFTFETTSELTDLDDFLGQDRAIQAVQFGISIARHGYNIFAFGPSGIGKHTLVDHFVQQRAATQKPPSDWCYVHNFQEAHRPRVLQLPPGIGRQLCQDMERLVEDLRTGLSTALESEEHQMRRDVLEAELRERQETSLNELQTQARERGLTLLRTPSGLAFAPLRDGNVISPEDFERLPEEEQKRLQTEVEKLQEQLQAILRQVPRWQREAGQRMRALDQEATQVVLNGLIDDLREKYAELPHVCDYLDAVQHDVSQNAADFLRTEQEGEANRGTGGAMLGSRASLRRYQVNVLVDASNGDGAPVIYESNPSYLNLVGRVEQMAQLGTLLTDFTLIKPGVLHRANGGYLILDADKVLTQAFAWEGLKRALQFRQIRIESPNQMLNLTSTVTVEPEPIPLDIKVILIGDSMLYYLLAQADPDFPQLFKVAADFDDQVARSPETHELYARLTATIVRKNELCPFDRLAVARVIEHSSRLMGDSARLTTRMQDIVDILEEADHWASTAGADVVTVDYVNQAINARIYRSDRIRERMMEQTLRETILIDTEGAHVGQINALSVLQLGNFAFGRPSRITASVRMGEGDVVDIEREVEMGGPTHSKGVLILSSFFRARYAVERPLSLAASLVFEQSYGEVDGDSASSTELYALLSAIARVPIQQSLAVTGSVSQYGQVQAIGGVNEKIEGFFDLCQARGLTGDQGVLIPKANVQHLMLRADVVEAVAAGLFHIYPIATIDQGIEILTGIPAGERDETGDYPEGTVNRLVEDRLIEIYEKRKALEKKDDTNDDTNDDANDGEDEEEQQL